MLTDKTSSFSSYSSTKSPSVPTHRILDKLDAMKLEFENQYVSEKSQRFTDFATASEIDPHLKREAKKTNADMLLDFDFSELGIYEVIEGLDKVEFTSQFFLHILKSLKSARKQWESKSYKNNLILNLKVRHDDHDKDLGPVDEDIANNFKIWYNGLDLTDQKGFCKWLGEYISTIATEDQLKSFMAECESMFGNMNELNNGDVLKTTEYSKSLIDIGGIGAIF
jgi:hypothetical protein